MTFNFEITDKRRLSQRISSHLTEMIVSGELAPGIMLPPEKELAEQFNVSRVAIRESTLVLAAKGLLDVRHGVGTFVNDVNAWQVEEPILLLFRAERRSLLHWLEIRSVMEKGFVELAATRATPKNLQVMADAIERMRAMCDHPEQCMKADYEFHYEIAIATGNAMALTLMRPLLRPIREYLLATIRMSKALDRAITEHLAIYDAVAAHSPQQAVKAMQSHLQRVRDEIESLHGKHKLVTGDMSGD